MHSELSGKRLQLLKEILPQVGRVAVVLNPDNPSNVVAWEEAQKAARGQAVKLQRLEVQRESDTDRALSAAVTLWHADAVRVFDDVVTFQYFQKLCALRC